MSRAERRCAPRELKLGGAVPLFTQSSRETVRKGSRGYSGPPISGPQSSETGLLRAVSSAFRLQLEAYRDFSDSFRREILGNPYTAICIKRFNRGARISLRAP